MKTTRERWQGHFDSSYIWNVLRTVNRSCTCMLNNLILTNTKGQIRIAATNYGVHHRPKFDVRVWVTQASADSSHSQTTSSSTLLLFKHKNLAHNAHWVYLDFTMKASLISTAFLLPLVCNANPESQRIVTNAMVQSATWRVTSPQDKQVEPALHRSTSYHELLHMRATSFAYREIKPAARRVPKTELEYLENSFGLKKSIR